MNPTWRQRDISPLMALSDMTAVLADIRNASARGMRLAYSAGGLSPPAAHPAKLNCCVPAAPCFPSASPRSSTAIKTLRVRPWYAYATLSTHYTGRNIVPLSHDVSSIPRVAAPSAVKAAPRSAFRGGRTARWASNSGKSWSDYDPRRIERSGTTFGAASLAGVSGTGASNDFSASVNQVRAILSHRTLIDKMSVSCASARQGASWR
jgi:hypothetical protein